ncbi:MAG: HIT domain-containing protein [Candidatus Pacearchaeota archaeon]
MPLTEEQAQKIKEHLLKQLEKFPEEKREIIKDQVESMTTSQVENFIEENKLSHLEGKENCIFCSIVSGKNPSFKIAEDENNIAILEINPISKAHTLIVPKKHDDKITVQSKEFAQKVAIRIKERFGPNEIQTEELNIMGHQLLEIIPIFGDEKDRSPANPEELKKIQEEIIKPEPKKEEPKEETKIEKKETPKEETVKIKARIP